MVLVDICVYLLKRLDKLNTPCYLESTVANQLKGKIMKYIGVDIRDLKSGRDKADVWGQGDFHIMDWGGCNFRGRPLPGQPHRGFDSLEDCETWLRRNWTKDTAKNFAEHCGDGSFRSGMEGYPEANGF